MSVLLTFLEASRMDRGQSTTPHFVHLAFAHVDMPILFRWPVQTDVSLNPQKSGSKSNNAVLQARHHDLSKFGMPSFFSGFASRIPNSQTEFSCCHQKNADAWGDHRRGTSGLCDVFPRNIVIVIAVLILYFHRVLIFSATLSSSTLEKTGYC